MSRRRREMMFRGVAFGCWIQLLIAASPAAGQNADVANSQKPEVLTLGTKDGVQLKATYYPSTEGKQAATVVLLHDYKGSRHEFDEYARLLQGTLPEAPTTGLPSMAVIVPDLRGHGESTRQMLFGGRVEELDASRLRRLDFARMIEFDMEAVRSHLVSENDLGRLNINKLALVGSGMGASIAINWAAKDWSMPPLATHKQGQDVKALALISPEWSFRGVPITQSINHPYVRSRISLFIAYGERDSSYEKDAERIYKIAERHHPPFDPSQGKDKQELFLLGRDTSKQGGEIFPSDVGIGFAIRDFIQSRVVSQEFPWTARKSD